MKGFRYWLADVISGGELTFQTEGWKRSNANMVDYREMARDYVALASDCDSRLSRIAALETPRANATVRKMARIARGEA